VILLLIAALCLGLPVSYFIGCDVGRERTREAYKVDRCELELLRDRMEQIKSLAEPIEWED
jgi:hypothetical protein